jgi:putative redox protein
LHFEFAWNISSQIASQTYPANSGNESKKRIFIMRLFARRPKFPALLFCSLGAFMQTASVKWIGEQKFVATSPSGHAVALDSDRESNKAPGPMELVLMALGACTATDVVIVLEKKRQKLESLEVICSGERAKEPPTVWTKLEIVYRLRGRLDDAAVKHAIQLSEDKYCSVAAMLKKTATFSWRYEILPPSS